MKHWSRFVCVVVLLVVGFPAAAETISADLLIVGGGESACAAAVQAARLGVKRIVLVNDINWLGGQFSAEAVGAVDEWTTVRGKRVNFPRSGLFLEVIQRIRALNSRKFGVASPGNAVCASETIEPAEAARIFEELLAPYADAGSKQIRILRPWEPVRVEVEKNRVTAVEFAHPDGSRKSLTVRAKLTVDCSDWGDVIRLSGAKYSAGPDERSRFGEPGAPEKVTEAERAEMNPISYCLVVRETGRDSTIPRPADYDSRSFAAMDKTIPFVDSSYPEGIYSVANQSVYTHRRLVDRRHNGFAPGTEKVLLNWPVQDYPLFSLPKSVAEALEATELGASKKNIVNMTPAQRRIVFDGAKQHALGMFYHLQTVVHDRVGDYPESFRYMELTDEFGTADRLPPKVYVREGLRLEALYMLREQDIRAADRQPRWASAMVPDAVFGFQFNIDFHPTRRKFLDGGDAAGPWQFIHTASRNWHTDTDRAMFPLRGLVPVERDGLLGGGKNIGMSSVVSAALRLHGQMMHVGQAAGTVAWIALRDGVEPRAVATNFGRVREVQQRLVRGCGGPGVLLWPWHDLAPDDAHFEAANLLAVRGIWQADEDSLDFSPWKIVTQRELEPTLARLWAVLPDAKIISDSDVPTEADATWGWLYQRLTALGLPASEGLRKQGALPLTRAECVRHLWNVLQQMGERHPSSPGYLTPGHDSDGDGIPDLDDPLPFVPGRGRIAPAHRTDRDGEPDPLPGGTNGLRQFHFTDKSAPEISGFQNDFGLLFDGQRGFGWRRDLSASNRRRPGVVGEWRASFIFTRTHDVWECLVPDGRYRVTVCVGDATNPQPGQNVTVEGVPALRDETTGAGEFAEKTVDVEVADGRLTIEIGREDATGNTCLNWLRFQPLPAKQ